MIHKPTIGRIVHFKASKEAHPEPALVCNVTNEEQATVTLAVFSSSGLPRSEVSVGYQGDSDEQKKNAERCWFWPPRS